MTPVRVGFSRVCSALGLIFFVVIVQPALAQPIMDDLIRATDLKEAGHYEQALVIAKQIEQHLIEAETIDDPVAAICSLELLGICHRRLGNLDEAEQCHMETASFHEEWGDDKDHIGYAIALDNLAMVLAERGEYVLADTLATMALEVERAHPEGAELDIIKTLTNLMQIKVALGRRSEAEALTEQLPPHPESPPDDMLRVMTTFYHDMFELGTLPDPVGDAAECLERATNHFDSGHLAKAVAALEEAEGILDVDSDDARRLGAHVLVKRGLCERRRGDLTAAVLNYERALGLHARFVVPDTTSEAILLDNLGVALRTSGAIARADTMTTRALELARASTEMPATDVAIILTNLAAIRVTQGDDLEAEELLDEAVAIEERQRSSGGARRPASALYKLAQVYDSLGRGDTALEIYQRVERIERETIGTDHPSYAMTLLAIADCHGSGGRHEEALALAATARSILEEQAPESIRLIEAKSVLARCQGNLGNELERQALLIEILQDRMRISGPRSLATANAQYELGVMFFERGQHADAESFLLMALEIVDESTSIQHPDRDRIGAMLFRTRYFDGRLGEAWRDGLALADRMRERAEYVLPGLPEEHQLSFAEGMVWFYHYFLATGLMQVQDGDQEATGPMLDFLLWTRGLVLNTVREQRELNSLQPGDRSSARYEKLGRLRRQLASFATNVSGGAKDDHVERIASLRREVNQIERELFADRASVRPASRSARPDWRVIRDSLQPGEAAVELFEFWLVPSHPEQSGGRRMVALVVRPDSVWPELVDLGWRRDLADEREKYREAVMKTPPRNLAFGKPNPRIRERLIPLGTTLWGALADALGDATRLYLDVDGVFDQLNIGLLCDESGAYYLDRYDLVYLNSLKSVSAEKRSRARRTALLIGNPAFDHVPRPPASEPPMGALALNRGWRSSPQVLTRSLDSIRESLTPWTKLTGTASEIALLGEQLRDAGWLVGSYTGEEATEDILHSREAPGLLHLATHGYYQIPDHEAVVDAGRPMHHEATATFNDPMMRSGLVLAGANLATDAGEPNDGWLTAYEIEHLDLRGTELVVLSACKTGLGQSRTGEGVFGLRRAFAAAGAGGVIISLWEVPDEATVALMTRFYAGWLAGESPDEALRLAQRAVRDDLVAEYGFDYPNHWAGFIYVGND